MLDCTIVSPLEQIDLASANAVYVTASNGQIGILPGHAPLVCGLAPESILRVAFTDSERHFRLGANAFLRLQNDRIVVLSAEYREISAT
ncbi:MAG TPA: hypothetical protein VMW87_00625 [Spirochaetia bacterium]|nr:hypothetical protein [Spirochaetia bacterium]